MAFEAGKPEAALKKLGEFSAAAPAEQQMSAEAQAVISRAVVSEANATPDVIVAAYTALVSCLAWPDDKLLPGRVG